MTATSTSITRYSILLDDDAIGSEIEVLVEADPSGTASICLVHGETSPLDEVTITGPAGALVEVASRMLTALRKATDQLGPVCRHCGQRGLNRGDYAIPVGRDMFEHVGCGADEERSRSGDERHLELVR